MSRSASGALLAWTDKGGLSGAEKSDMLRIALRLAGYEPRVQSKLAGGGHAALMEALLPEALRPGKRDCRLSLERCVSVMLGGGVPEDRVLSVVVNKTNAAGALTQNSWQEHVESRSLNGEFYIAEARAARAQIRAWAAEPSRRAVICELAGFPADTTPAAGDAPAEAEEDEGAPALPSPKAAPVAAPKPSPAAFKAPPPPAAAKPRPAPPPAPRPAPPRAPVVPATLGAPKPRAPPPAPPPPPPPLPPPPRASPPLLPRSGGAAGIRVRIEINDELFNVTPEDLEELGLTADKLGEWYSAKAGRPLRAGGGSPAGLALAAARAAAAAAALAAAAPALAPTALGGALAAAAAAAPSGNATPAAETRVLKRAAPEGGDAPPLGAAAGGPLFAPGAENVHPAPGAHPAKRAAADAAPFGSPPQPTRSPPAAAPPPPPPPPPLPAEHERLFSDTLLRVTARRGECDLPELRAALAGALGGDDFTACLAEFERRNRIMVDGEQLFMIC